MAGPRRLFYPDSGQRIRKSALADLRAFWGVSISDFFRDAMSAGADLRVNHLTNEPRWRQRAAHAVDAGRWRDARRPSRKFPDLANRFHPGRPDADVHGSWCIAEQFGRDLVVGLGTAAVSPSPRIRLIGRSVHPRAAFLAAAERRAKRRR